MARTKGSKNKPKVSISMAGEQYVSLEPPKGLQEAFNEVIYKAEDISKKKMIEGWINVYKHKGETCTFFFTGSDIHPTKEGAMTNAQRNCLGQVFISIEDK